MPAKPKSRKSKKRVDPNQLCLLDFLAENPAKPIIGVKTRRPRAKRSDQDGTAPAVMSAMDAARYLNVSPNTLKSWRGKRKGPVVTNVGARLIGYKQSDLDAFLGSNSRR